MITDAYLEKVKNLSAGDVLYDCDQHLRYAGVVLSATFSADGVTADILRGGRIATTFYPYGEWVHIASEIDGLRLYELGL